MNKSVIRTALLAASTMSALVSCGGLHSPSNPAATPASPAPLSATTDDALALAWAPILHQDVDQTGSHGLSGKADFITNVDFDGDWNATNNWAHAANYPLAAHGYYSVVETSTHWYLTYAYYHPRDWTDNPFGYDLDEHENDLEGLLLIVGKDGSTYGQLQAMVTVFHSNFYSFLPKGSPLLANEETVDGTVQLVSYNGTMHPVIAQECQGHGLKAEPYVKINGDGVIYYPSSTVAEIPSSCDDRDVKYKLVDLFAPGGLWENRTNPALFASDQGSFLKSYGHGGANAPWHWDDGDDKPGVGELATDPAHLAACYFKNFGAFSAVYVRNGYRGIK